MKIGLIGYGYWGKILLPKLENFGDVVFVCTSKDNYKERLKEVDWVVVATPSQTHYDIVKYCLEAGVNVFCEKSLTLDYYTSFDLYSTAELYNVKLYVNDVFMFRNKIESIKESISDEINVNWLKQGRSDYGKFIMSNLYNLAWHDFYLLHNIFGEDFSDIKKIDTKRTLSFSMKLGGKKINFCYDRLAKENSHSINGVNLMHDGNDADALVEMFKYVFNNDDYSENKDRTLFCARLIDKLRDALFTNIDVVGGGIFGVTCAWMLSKNGYYVRLYEKNSDIISSASAINQYRLHRGYHYPRSDETALLSKVGEKSFLEHYGDTIIQDVENHYCIASKDSKVTKEQFLRFMERIDLEYEEVDTDLVKKETIDLCVKVKELLFDSDKLRDVCKDLLGMYCVKVFTNREYKNIHGNLVVNCTYSNKNELSIDKKDLQFELCEKPVIKLPKKFRNKSFVIMDGPFMCIDPYGDTDYHVMGNVVHAIHERSISNFPNIPSKYEKMLNSGVVKDCKEVTKIEEFMKTFDFFFGNAKWKHIGSMFTIRTVLPNREHDDARPTFYERNNGVIDVLSGKIGTCVDLAQKIVDDLNA